MEFNLCHTYTPRWALLPCRVKGQLGNSQNACQPCFSSRVFFSPFSRELNGVAGACACGCASVGPGGLRRETRPPVGHEGATCPSPGTVPPSHPRLCQLCPQTSWRRGRHAVASCPQEPGGWGPGQALSHPGLGGSDGAGGTRAAPLHQQLSLPGQLPGRGRGRGARQLHPGVQLTQARPLPVQLQPCPSPGSGCPVGR